MRHEVELPDELAPDTARMVLTMADRMGAKLAQKQEAKGTSWRTCSWYYLKQQLYLHLMKGDPVDVANFCAMLLAQDKDTRPDVSVEFCGVRMEADR